MTEERRFRELTINVADCLINQREELVSGSLNRESEILESLYQRFDNSEKNSVVAAVGVYLEDILVNEFPKAFNSAVLQVMRQH